MNDDEIPLIDSEDEKNMNIGEESDRLSGGNYVSFIKLSKSGKYLAVGIETNYIDLWDFQARKKLATFKGCAFSKFC